MAAPPSLALVRQGFDQALAAAAPLEAQLRNAYHRELNRLVKQAARNFARHAITASGAESSPVALVASSQSWQMPDVDEILPHAQATAALQAATGPTRVKLVSKLIGGATAAVGVSFDVQNPLAQTVLSNLGSRITNITDLTRAEIMQSLGESFDKGLSIPHAARAMASQVGATNVKRATLIARTEFIGAQNGSSLAAVQYTGAATTKTWLATNDNRTRQDHADASGQTVPLADPFDVGGYPMMHPGDQNAPPEEVCNCRCTMTYGDEGGQGADFGGGFGLGPLDLSSPGAQDLGLGLDTPELAAAAPELATPEIAPELAGTNAHAAANRVQKALLKSKVKHHLKIKALKEDDAATARALNTGHIGVHGDGNEKTLANAITHEVGHMLDRSVLGTEDEWFSESQKGSELWKALRDTPTMKRVKADGYAVLEGDSQLRNYMLSGREMFARAFHQYVAERSGDELLLDELKHLQSDELIGFQVWQPEEFKPIAKIFDKLLGNATDAELEAAGADVKDFAQLAAKHPVGSTRAYYKNGNGYKLGTHDVVEHNPIEGTITIKSHANGELKTVKPHELKKPHKPKTAPHEPVTSNPLVEQAHAAQPLTEAQQNENLFPTGSIQEHQGEPVEVLGHGTGPDSGLIHVVDMDGLDYYVTPKDLGAQKETLKFQPKPAEPGAIVVGKTYHVDIYGEQTLVKAEAVNGDVVTATALDGPGQGGLMHLSAKNLHPAGEESIPVQGKFEQAQLAELEGKTIVPGDLVYDDGVPMTITKILNKGDDGHFDVTVSDKHGHSYDVSTKWLSFEKQGPEPSPFEQAPSGKTMQQLAVEAKYPTGSVYFESDLGQSIEVTGHTEKGYIEVKNLTTGFKGTLSDADLDGLTAKPLTGPTPTYHVGQEIDNGNGLKMTVTGHEGGDQYIITIENKVQGTKIEGVHVKAENIANEAKGAEVKTPVTNPDLSSTLPEVGTKSVNDFGGTQIIGHTDDGKLKIINSDGAHSTITLEDWTNLADEPGAETIPNQFPTGATATYNGQTFTIKGFDENGQIKIVSPQTGNELTVYQSQLTDIVKPGELPPSEFIPTKPPVGTEGTYEGYNVKVAMHPTDAEKLIVEDSAGNVKSINASEFKAGEQTKPGTLAKPHAPVDGTFIAGEGNKVTFDSAFDPDHPYNKATNPNPPIGKGKGTIVSVDYQTNQVIVNVGTKANPKFVQTHLSKIRDVKTGKSADWQVGGGHPSQTAPSISYGGTPSSSFAAHEQEYIAVPKPLTGRILDSVPYRNELAHDALELDVNARSAVQDYSGSAYRSLNSALRNKSVPALAKQIDRAFDQVPTTEHNGILHRWTNLSDIPSANNLQVGQVIHDDGFVSTSTSPTRTSGFGRDYLEIEVPKGASVIDLNALKASIHSTEHELLLKRGARFVVTHIEQGGPGPMRIKVRLITGKYKPLKTNPNL